MPFNLFLAADRTSHLRAVQILRSMDSSRKRGPSAAAKGTMKAFAKRLRELRESRSITQRDLAELLKVQIALISRYERGLSVPSAATIVELARVLHVSTDELLVGSIESSDGTLEIRHAVLLDRFRQLDQEIEDRKELETILSLLDAFLAKKRLKKLIA